MDGDNIAMIIQLEGGKYTFVAHDGKATALRYNEKWRDCTGDKFIFAMADEIESLQQKLVQERVNSLLLTKQLEKHQKAEPAATVRYCSGCRSFSIENHMPDVLEAGMKLYLREEPL
jgi:methyltransferase-like protein